MFHEYGVCVIFFLSRCLGGRAIYFYFFTFWGLSGEVVLTKPLYTLNVYHISFSEKPKESPKVQKQTSEKGKQQIEVDIAAESTNLEKFVEKVIEKFSSEIKLEAS